MLLEVILQRRQVLGCQTFFTKLGKKVKNLADLGQITGRSLINTGLHRSFKRRATRQRHLESLRRVAHCTLVVQCPWGLLGGNCKLLLVDHPIVMRYGRRHIRKLKTKKKFGSSHGQRIPI
ncbi:uncharacterized protein LOC132614073 isoform X2 [Lycium barbarum]|nr:uncharacterized protein LOC132614073 isoform X2 [Lycium barbarum]